MDINTLTSSLYPDRFSDTYSSWPLRALSYCRSVSEAVPLPRWASLSLTLATLGYGAQASYERGRRAAALERHPELHRKANVSASLDSALTLWLECITLPSIGCGLMHRLVAAAGLPPAVLLRGAGGAASLALLPLLVLPASAHCGDVLMEWAFRPSIRLLAQPSKAVYLGAAQYVPSMGEEGLEGSLGEVSDFRALIPADMDELQRAQLEWALDGKLDSAYPEPAGAAKPQGK
jgi:hypothetical protein